MELDKIIRELKYKISLIESSQSNDYIRAMNLQSKLFIIIGMLADYLRCENNK